MEPRFMKKGISAVLVVLVSSVVILVSATVLPVFAGTRGGFLKCNIHYQQHATDAKASYANWVAPPQAHFILPVNTEVSIGRFRRGFSIIAKDSGKEILFELDEGRAGVNEEQYLKFILSPAPISLDGLSDLDQQGIKDGRVSIGMTKKGVMTALGYPAPHRTPSPDENKNWIYWTNRFRSFSVVFDDNGVVTDIKK